MTAGALITLAATSFSACDTDAPSIGAEGREPTTLVLATGLAQDASANAALARAVDELRDETRSGWTGRQDEVTGLLAELSGGRYFVTGAEDGAAVASGFLDAWGTRLFGVTSVDLALEDETPPTPAGSTSLRGRQELGGVPVLDGQLVFTIGDAEDEPRLNADRGRVFPGLAVDPEPDLSRTRAERRAEAVSGGIVLERPELVVVPEGAGRLAWQVTITQADEGSAAAPADGHYFVDAHTGALVAVRPASAEGRTPVRLPSRSARASGSPLVAVRTGVAMAPDPASVEVTGTAPTGETLTANGVRTSDGVLLVDTTVPTWDGDQQRGGIWTYDMAGSEDDAQLPGRLYAESPANGTTISDPEAIAAHAFSRAVYDYYGTLGWASWDGQGSDLISSIRYSDAGYCNSYFNGRQMVYGTRCAPNGEPAEISELDVDTAGHEITHGVIDSSAGLVYSGQSGAMNESFADYFGNVIGDGFSGQDSDAVMEHVCVGITPPTIMCQENPDGTASLRYMANGTTFDDYFFLLDSSTAKLSAVRLGQDFGGVHTNSAIWNNALWSIRSRLAQMDDSSALESDLAQAFDRIVFSALTTQIGPTAGFVDARRAIEQTTVEAGADPVILRVEREVFDANNICAGCGLPAEVTGEIVSNAAETETLPTVSGDRIAWLSRTEGPFGAVASGAVGGQATAVDGGSFSTQAVFGGEALVGLDFPDGLVPGRIVRFDPASGPERLGDADRASNIAGLAGSDDGAAWVTKEAVWFVAADGNVTSTALGLPEGEDITAIGTGGGVVGLGTSKGRVARWTPGGDIEVLGGLSSPVLSMAAYGDRVLAVDLDGSATIFGTGTEPVEISTEAKPFGAAMNADYAVWTQRVGELGGGAAAAAGNVASDTDLFLLSFATGTVYDLMETRGQQGFPALSGDRLVWQDAVYGGDDILTATIPSGL